VQGALQIEDVIELPHVRMERVTQDASGPFFRAHRVNEPSLIYIPPPHRESARGSYGEPGSPGSLMSFGAAVFLPGAGSVHIQSPGFPKRTMLVLRFLDDEMKNLVNQLNSEDHGLMMKFADLRHTRIIEIIDRLSQEMNKDAVGRDLILKGLGLVLVGEMARYLASVSNDPPLERGTLADWQMRRISERLTDESKAPPGVPELAAICGLSRRHLMRAFKATTGMTVMEWVEHGTFDRAMRLLGGADSIKSISARLGYACPGSFASAFARKFGVPPRQWRRRNGRGSGQSPPASRSLIPSR
jgi:AraC family transcriptional regulator